MEGLSLFNIIIWAIAGALNLASKEIDKFSYAIMWVVLMINLVSDCVRAFAG
jgi:hypothetical protein